MNWQVKYAIANIREQSNLSAEHVEGDLIRIASKGKPDVLAAISGAHKVERSMAESYRGKYPELDFLCGYRTACVWHGDAIEFCEKASIGWGSAGTLTSAALDGDANTAPHKTYKFSDRLLRQYGPVQSAIREYDRVYNVTLKSGKAIRLGMIAEYEPTADAVRSLWDEFGPMDIIWNINPNGHPSAEAVDAARELGSEVLKWEELRDRLKTA